MTSKVYVALRVKATPERAFAVFTGEIGAWWRPSGLFQTTPRAPGRLAFQDGRLIETLANGKVHEIGKVLAWAPPSHLIFSWRQASFPPDIHTEVEVRFEAIGDETRVSVEHRGFDQVPAESAARHGFPDHALLARLSEFWQSQIRAVGERTRET